MLLTQAVADPLAPQCIDGVECGSGWDFILRAKRRLIEIQHAAPQATRARRTAYRDLITLAEATAGYAACAIEELSAQVQARLEIPSGAASASPPLVKMLVKLHRQLTQYLSLLESDCSDGETRAHGETVPATSFFSPARS